MQLCFLVTGFLVALIGTPFQSPTPDQREEIGIVLVISKTAIDALVKDEIEMKIPIIREVKGIAVTGEAIGRGTPQVEFVPSPNSARFTVVVNGTADAHFSSTVGPATVCASTVASFRSQKQILFDGQDFRGMPTQTTNCNRTTVDQICARPRRLAGRLVRRVAGGIARRNKCEIDREVVIATREIIDETFEQTADQLLASLDISFPFGDVVRKYFPETKDWTFALMTRSDSIVAGIGPPTATMAAEFADGNEQELLGDQPPALAELWLKTTPGQAAMLKLAADWNVAYHVLQDKVEPDLAKRLLDEVKLVNVKGWSVIRVGIVSAPTLQK